MYGDINGYSSRGGKGGGGGGRRAVGTADFYRRVPKEMTESTKLGVLMSFISLTIMVVLFFCETFDFLFKSTKISSYVDIDNKNYDQLLRLNFNITLYDVQCEFVEVDVWDTLGTNLQNITKDITKWTIDEEGTQQRFHGRNKDQRKVAHETHNENALHEISESNGGELHSTDLTPDTISNFLNEEHDVAIIDYFAPWCIWCQRLAPTWEKFAQEIQHEQHSSHVNKLGVGKVDCVAQQQMCKDERIMAFPTLRWYENGQPVMPDYRGDRTVDALVEYATNRIHQNYDDKDEEFINGEHHPGCQVSGHLMVNRVPGNLHMEAKSTNHAINSAMTNLTHRVHHFSFGSPDGLDGHLSDHILWQDFFPFYSDIPKKYQHTNPMKDKYYPTYHFHEAFHHHLKVISTHMNSRGSKVLYQILEESQLVMYDIQNVPEIKFLWDMSPMSVNVVKETDKHWYDYITSLLAIIGGTYTTLGLINRTLLAIFKWT